MKPLETTWDFLMSYSRDDKQLAHSIFVALEERGRRGWVDLEDIRPASEWLPNILDGIDRSDVLLFCLSNTSLKSRVCIQEELRHALEVNKKIIPVVIHDFDAISLPKETLAYYEKLKALNYIYMREGDDFQKGLDQIEEAIDTDLTYLKAHTALLWEARQWEEDRLKSRLMRGRKLNRAKAWLKESRSKEPPAARIQVNFIRESIRRRVQRTIYGISAMIGIGIIGFLGYDRIQKEQLLKNYNKAVSQQNAAYRHQALKRYPQTQYFARKARQLFEQVSDSSREDISVMADQMRRLEEGRFVMGSLSPIPVWQSEVIRSKDGRRARVRDVLHDPGGNWWAAAGQSGEILIWSKNGENSISIPRQKGFVDNITDLDIDSDGRWLAAAHDNNHPPKSSEDFVVIWRVDPPESGELPSLVQTAVLPAPNVTNVAWSKHGTKLAAVCGGHKKPNFLLIWEMADGTPSGNPTERIPISIPHDAQFSPDDQLLAVASGKEVLLFDLSVSPPQLSKPEGGNLGYGHHNCLDFSWDGKYLLVGGDDYKIRIFRKNVTGPRPLYPGCRTDRPRSRTPGLPIRSEG